MNSTKKTSCIRVIYALIGFFAEIIDRNFEISCYLLNENSNQEKGNFPDKAVIRFITKNNVQAKQNRLILAISIDDNSCVTQEQSLSLLTTVLSNIEEKIWKSSILDTFEQYEPNATIKFFSQNTSAALKNHIIIVFNMPNNSSIDVIISTNKLGHVIEKNEYGDTVEYNGKLHKIIPQFEKERKKT